MRRRFAKFFEKVIEAALLVSGTFTSVIVLLIILFLFSEGAGLFRESPIEKGSVVALNRSNPVDALSPEQLKNIFDQKIVFWNSLGGTSDSIRLFRVDDITKYYTEAQIGSNFEHLDSCISDLVGKWYTNTAINSSTNGSLSYAGFSDDQSSSASNDLTAVLTNTSVATDPEQRIQRLRDTTIRALSSSGQTRVWNLMIDLVVQTGRYPITATGFNNFMVDGEVHYWVHLSIDRLTGQLLDRRVETVKE